MPTLLLWTLGGALALAAAIALVRWLDKLLLRAEEKGWIYYRKKSGGGSFSSGVAGAMNELDRCVRPSAEYRIEAEHHIAAEDERGGE
jgi:hypothetical protein